MNRLNKILLFLTAAYALSGCAQKNDAKLPENTKLPERYYVTSSDSLPTYVIEKPEGQFTYFKDLDKDGYADIRGSGFLAFGKMYRGSKLDTLPAKTYRMDELDKYDEGSYLW